MKNYIQAGDVMTVVAPYDVASGGLVVVGSIVGVATAAALAGAPVEIVCGGVYDLAKVAAQAWTQGVALYWDPATKTVTSVAGALVKIGVAALPAANPSGFGRVRLNASF